jgi:MFS family permease
LFPISKSVEISTTRQAIAFLKFDLSVWHTHDNSRALPLQGRYRLKLFGSRKKPDQNQSVDLVKVPAFAWRTCIFLASSVILVLFVHTSLSPALPLFVNEFGISYALASWALTAYMISGAVMTIIIGRLADIFGSRKMLLVELACFAVGTGLAGFAQDFYMLLVIRALQGIAVANTPLALKIVREQFPKEKFSIGSSIIIASFSGGMVVGLVLGAQIVGELGWREVFFISAPLALALFVIAWRYVGRAKPREQILPSSAESPAPPPHPGEHGDIGARESGPIKSRRKEIDVRGAIALAVSLTSFLLAITFGGTLPATLTEFLVFLAAGTVSIIVFFMLEKRTRYPLINLKIMFGRLMVAGNLIFLFAGVVEYVIFQATPTLATAPPPSGFGLPVSASGLIQLPYAAMVIVFGLLAGVFISKKGPLKLLLPGLAIGLVSVGLLAAFHATFLGTSVALAIFGIGFTLVVTAANYTMITSNPMEYTGVISSTTTDLRVIGGAIGPLIAGTIMALFVVPYEIGGEVQYYPSPMAFNLIFIVAFVVALAQAVLILIFRRRSAILLKTQRNTGGAAAA